jgi:hypothetical protein
MGKNNLSNESFWLDESGQFWMAKGLYHFSQPLSKEGNVLDLINENSRHNMDPGGFTIILHYWSEISDSAVWLRSLPYTFFILSMMAVAFLVYFFTKSIGLSLASLYYIPIMRGGLLYYAFELRAYSMEYLGLAISFLLFVYFLRKRTDRNLLIFTSIVAFFCTSRYSFIIFGLILSFVTFAVQRFQITKIKYYMPIFISIVLIYFLSFRSQFSMFETSGYTSALMFKHLPMSAIVSVIQTNLFTARGIFFTSSVAFGFAVLFLSNIRQEKNFLIISLVLFLYNLSFCIFSFLGIHIWNINSRWNIGMEMINLLSLSVVVGYLYNKIRNKRNRLEKYIPVIVLLIFVIFEKDYFKYIKFYFTNYYRDSTESVIANIRALEIGPNNKFYVSSGDIPNWKYLNEYGSFRNEYYPANTIFGKPNEEPVAGVDYVIQSDSGEINLNDFLHKKLYKDITVFEPSHIYKSLGK